MADEGKKVVEQVTMWLKVYDDGTVDRTWTGPPEVEFMMKPFPRHEDFVDGVAVRDLTIDENSGLSARIYLPERLPEDGESKLPILLHFHGGGFCVSRAQWYLYYHVYARLARQARVICVSVDQRLAPEHRLPAAIDDCYSSLLWLRSVARAESTDSWLKTADFSRVFLTGDSSGANILHQVAARAGTEDMCPLKIAGGVLLHPGFVREQRSKSELMKENESPLLTLEMVDKFMSLGLPLGSTKDHPIACPMGPLAPPLSGLNLPPYLVALAKKDLILDTGLEFIEEMKKAGKDVEVFMSNEMGHVFHLNKIAIDMDPNTAAQNDLLLGKITDFIQRH